MKTIINDSFMLKNETAKYLWEIAEGMPIIDYHCHLNPKMIAENHAFRNLADLFLGGDHYKWRQMRSFGIDEHYITGDAPDKEKFLEFAAIMPYLIGNPIYHWTHLELKRYFDVDEALTPESAERIWEHCNALLATEPFRARELIRRSNVKVLCTTDDPADDLRYHKQLREMGYCVKVLPTFRPDKLINIDKETFLPYLEAQGLKSYADVKAFVSARVDFFHAEGCCLSDHGLDRLFYGEGDAEAVFAKVMAGESISDTEAEIYKTDLLLHCAKEYTAHGWTMQLHIGALRNNNTRMYRALGPDVGFDSINDGPVAEQLSALMDRMDTADALPKTILYNLNPKDNYVLATMLGNFQRAPFKGKIQFGSGWWFCDQRDGMEAQLRALANLGMLPTFVGMLTDSRSFVSYPRHEYFRRILCNLLGTWVEGGEYPGDRATLAKIVKDICYNNAAEYFGFDF